MTSRREFFYELDDRGTLTLNGYIQDDPWFLDFVFRRMASSADPNYPEYPWVCRCGDEMNYIRPVDTPIVFQHFDEGRLWYAPGLSVAFDPATLSYSEDGVMYHAAPIGTKGRLVPSIVTALAKDIAPWGPYFAYMTSAMTSMASMAYTQRATVILPNDVSNDTAASIRVLRPREENMCVGCGQSNEAGLALTFLYDSSNGEVSTYLVPDSRMHGSMNTVHGGWVSLLLDEIMGKGLSVRGLKAPTAQLNVRFRKPMSMGVEHKVMSYMTSQDGRKTWMHGEIRRVTDNELVAEAEGLFITVGATSL